MRPLLENLGGYCEEMMQQMKAAPDFPPEQKLFTAGNGPVLIGKKFRRTTREREETLGRAGSAKAPLK
jgi:hypothetical protein